jgi:hypothetical protein
MPVYDWTRTPVRNLFETSFREVPAFLGELARNDGGPPLFAACAILILMAFIFGTCTGLLVGRLQRQHRNTMIALYAATVLVTVLPNIGGFAVVAYSTKTFGAVSHFLIYSANNTSLIAGIIAAGFLNRRSSVRP